MCVLAYALRFFLLSLIVALAGGCSDECIDEDGDGRGVGCDDGPDCDDKNPAIREGCDSLPPVCLEDASAEGCPCLAGSSRGCYDGPEGTDGVGVCRSASKSCLSGTWGACDAAVTPRFEQCNRVDDDCDGIADEGVQSPCGGCNADCVGGVWGTDIAPFELDADLDLTVIGELTLTRTELQSVAVWVPNSGDQTVSKIDAEQAAEVARYPIAGDAPAERLAVDYNGDAWVLTSALEGRSSLLKLAATEDRCIDRDGDGLATSSGPEDVLPVGADECVLLELPVGDDGDYARSLSVDGTAAPDGELGGHVWVGLAGAQRLLELDGETGELLREVALPELTPHASVFDPWGALWIVDRDGKLGRVNPAVDPPEIEVIEVPLSCYELESIASDDQGVLTLTGFACENVTLFDPALESWEQVETDGVLTTRGVTLLGREAWVTHTAGSISRVTRDPLAIAGTFPLASDDLAPLESIEAAADSLGQLWFVSSMGGPNGTGLLTRFDADSEQVTAQIPLGRLPRPLGDLTGTRRQAQFVPEGRTTHRFDGCSEPTLDPDEEPIARPTDWKRVHLIWAAGVESEVLVEARHARQAGDLRDADWVLLGTLPRDDPPFDVDFETGGVVEIRLTLRAHGYLGAPRISQVGLEWQCPGPD